MRTKYNGCRNDCGNYRGHTTYLQINIDALRVQTMSHIDNAKQQNLIALIGQDAAISTQIEAAGRRAEICYKEYDEKTIIGKKWMSY